MQRYIAFYFGSILKVCFVVSKYPHFIMTKSNLGSIKNNLLKHDFLFCLASLKIDLHAPLKPAMANLEDCKSINLVVYAQTKHQ